MSSPISVLRQVAVRQEGTRVLILEAGKVILDLPWDAAINLGRAIRIQALKAEEIDKADKVAFDHAILLRSGAPFGLALNARVRQLGEHEAQYNRELRRYLPSIKSQESVGVPAIANLQVVPEKKG